MKKLILTLLVISLFTLVNISARDFRVAQIPNGNKFSCNTCHTNGGGTPRNAFGQLVESNYLDGSGNVLWSKDLAMIDSDGDGFTNGEELQDPKGTWISATPNPGNSSLVTSPGNISSLPSANILIANNSTYGNILTDIAGNTLYFFSKDAFEASVCNDQCEVNWPVFYSENISAGGNLNQSDFATILREDSSKQTTYKGWPLYYFFNDLSSGETKGENVNGVWFVAKPEYSIMLVNNQLLGHNGLQYNGNYEQGQEEIQYFVDGYGRTLYTFVNDEFDKNKFTKEDFSNNAVWPIYETENIIVPSNIDTSLFNVIDVFGKKQLSYKGWPLYYFGQDSMMRGYNKGISFPSPGVWPVAKIDIGIATDILEEKNPNISSSFNLSQNYPNPFNPSTTINFSIPEASIVKIKIYDIIGREVATILNKNLSAGSHELPFDASSLESGVYVYRISANNFSDSKKMILMK
ncbi:MAG: T9SS type A sorting domain-containing protein [Ignavibacteriae bacterium]|nr:T9SS type A sorting domain-containing protein [Ignavibacteriota bacterium]